MPNIKSLIKLPIKYILNKYNSNFYDIFYVIEDADWSIKWDGFNLEKCIKNLKVTTSIYGLKNKIIHFGTNGLYDPHIGKNNLSILTYFHISPIDPMQEKIAEISKSLELIHTSCNLTKYKLIKLGVPEKKIIVIPIPVDLVVFKPRSEIETSRMKENLNLPKDKFIIGSFQKDGVGWGEGLEPKLIKGPDVFCDIIEKLARDYPIHVLLTGPARGYVKNRLEKAKISYTHVYLKNYLEIAEYYNVLDLYLVTSREEGGPKAILESMACGVPLISTKVGQAPDIIQNGKNGFLVEVEDRKNILIYASNILDNKKLKERLIKNGLKTVKKYELKKIAREYYKKLYLPLLKK